MRSLYDVFGDLLNIRAKYYKDEENILNEQIEIVRSEFSQFVGKCYKTKPIGNKHAYYKVIGLPMATQDEYGHIKFEPYLLHAIVLITHENDVPTKYRLPKVSFMNIWCCRRGVDHISDEYDEISQEEFDKALLEQIHNIESYKEDKVG